MNPLVSLIALGLSLAVATGEASACRIPPRGLLPIRGDEAAVLATVTSHGENGAELRFDDMLDGRVDGRTASIAFGARPGTIVVTCGPPPGPPVRTGALLLVVLSRHEGRQIVRGWTTPELAAEADDFFALYQGARRPSERRRLRARWRQVNRHFGPVPLSDPEHWLPPYVGALGWAGPQGLAYVRFQVADDGRIVHCNPHGAPAVAGARICDGIRDRRFEPPLFARERHGFFRVRWNEPAGGD